MRQARYDVALDMQGLWKSALWTRVAGARRCLGWSAGFRREPSSAWLLAETRPVPGTAVHVIDKNLSLLAELGIDAVGERAFPLPAPAESSARVERSLAQRGKPFALLIPGGGWRNKLWPIFTHGVYKCFNIFYFSSRQYSVS